MEIGKERMQEHRNQTNMDAHNSGIPQHRRHFEGKNKMVRMTHFKK
jgi:hypothetical protein